MHTTPLRSFALLGALLVAVMAEPATDAPDASPYPSSKCRCQPTEPCWPSNASWSKLKDKVEGRLITTTPAAYECRDPHFNSVKCDEIKTMYYKDLWRQQQPGAMRHVNWEVFEGQGCLGFSQTASCSQGAVPLYTVNATSIEDVKNSIRFASTHNIRLVIKNTGHDYLGRSIGASSLNLWVYYMKDIAFNDNFVPEGAADGTIGSGAIILGSGVLWKDAYKAADEHNVIVVGGADATVGTSGGFCQGGGHGPLSPRHGLCVDNVLQYKVVTADGELRVANAHRNTDLFWALRGGGGSTFGVVVEAVYKTHPPLKSLSYTTYMIHFNDSDVETSRSITNNFLSHQTEWSKAGWSGYSIVQNGLMIVTYYLPDSDTDTALKSFSPFLEHVNSLPGVKVQGGIQTFPSFYSGFQVAAALAAQNSIAGRNAILGSRLIPRSNFNSSEGVDQLANALVEIRADLRKFGNPTGTYVTLLVAGGQVAKGTRKETSVLPAWRRALMHIVTMTGWKDDTPVQVQRILAGKLTDATQRLRDLTPDSGSYFNEADPHEPKWRKTFFGNNYRTLRIIKNKFDPNGLFACRNCVGSEDWNRDLTCRR
ncbi:hypothetical protein BGX28_003127 [Mortierella sp. GBA30]|nr:hypothetical protein BGX28_003127 [Mortierella sp. GBA30]